MRSLRELQSDFSQHLFDAGSNGILDEIDGDGFTPGQRLQIYRNNLFISLTDALAADYPVIQRLVGDEFFAATAREYITRHPSRCGSLHSFGAVYSDFLRGFAPAASLPYLPAVAALEWAWQEAYHAASHGPFDPTILASVAEDHYAQLRFLLHPSARMIRSPWPILSIWQANQPEAANEQTINLNAGGESVLVLRPGLEVTLVPLEATEATWLMALADGATLEQSLAFALGDNPAFDLNQLLTKHIQLGTLVDAQG